MTPLLPRFVALAPPLRTAQAPLATDFTAVGRAAAIDHPRRLGNSPP